MKFLRRTTVIYQPDSSDKSSLRGKVFNTVRESILEGKYKAGDVLRETVIANELNVSRTPVREAIRQLELEGLVQSIPNKETIVAGVSKEDVQDIFMIRNKLEGLAGRRAAERITQEELEQMEEVLALTAFYIAKNDIDHINELDHKFHDIIYKATKSKILKHMLSDFHSYVQSTRKESIATPGRAKRLLEEHTGIYDAIRERNAEKVEMLITKHVQNVTMNMHL
jgi:DNA-binding GntR family transcriptional regulator